jgi:hypothetical protein
VFQPCTLFGSVDREVRNMLRLNKIVTIQVFRIQESGFTMDCISYTSETPWINDKPINRKYEQMRLLPYQ